MIMSKTNDDFDAIEESMAINMKRVVIPMLILRRIAASDATIAELKKAFVNASNGALALTKPYDPINKFKENGYIECVGPQQSHHVGRHSEVYRITQKGLEALTEYERVYEKYTDLVADVSLVTI